MLMNAKLQEMVASGIHCDTGLKQLPYKDSSVLLWGMMVWQIRFGGEGGGVTR